VIFYSKNRKYSFFYYRVALDVKRIEEQKYKIKSRVTDLLNKEIQGLNMQHVAQEP
jgi:hypothetical protein